MDITLQLILKDRESLLNERDVLVKDLDGIKERIAFLDEKVTYLNSIVERSLPKQEPKDLSELGMDMLTDDINESAGSSAASTKTTPITNGHSRDFGLDMPPVMRLIKVRGSVTKAIINLLQNKPGGYAGTDVARLLEDTIESGSTNRRRLIQSTLANLRNRGAVTTKAGKFFIPENVRIKFTDAN